MELISGYCFCIGRKGSATRKLYIICCTLSVLIALAAVFLMLQPRLWPVEELYIPPDTVVTVPPESSSPTTEPPGTEPPDTTPGTEPPGTEPIGTEPPETKPPVEPTYYMPQRLEKAMAQNPDVYAWISVPGTNIDFPVLQHPTKDSYYLRRDIDGTYLTSGCIMTEHSYNTTTFEDPVTVIYGHAMKSGAKFGKLQSYYSNRASLDAHKTIIVYTATEMLEYDVYAAVPFDAVRLPAAYNFSNAREFAAFFRTVGQIRSFNATVVPGERPEWGDKVLVLSTCLMGDSSRRFLVIAKLK